MPPDDGDSEPPAPKWEAFILLWGSPPNLFLSDLDSLSRRELPWNGGWYYFSLASGIATMRNSLFSILQADIFEM